MEEGNSSDDDVRRRPTAPDRDMAMSKVAGEREILEGMLDWYREGVLLKVSDIPDALAHRMELPTSTSIAGLVRHLAVVEDSWVTRFLQVDEVEPWASAPWDDDRDWEFHVALDEPLAASVALYERAIARARTELSGHAIDEIGGTAEKTFALRWMLVHLLEETARHLGHLDILVELFTGQAGE